MAQTTPVGSRSLAGRRKYGLGWLPWVGEPGRRVLAFLTPQARTKAGESPFQVRGGQRVQLTGTVRPLPNDLTPFGVDSAEGADELRRQGHYVEATAVALS